MTLEGSVVELCELAKRLNHFSDRLNAGITAVESQLRESGLGIEYWLDDPLAVSGGNQLWLGWVRMLGLCVSEEPPAFESGDDRREIQELRSCSRAIRIEAYAHLGRLVDAMTAEVQTTLAALESIEDDLPVAVESQEQAAAPSSDDIPF